MDPALSEGRVDRDCEIRVAQDDGAKRDLDVVASFPFAATTRDSGPVTGRVLYAESGAEAADEVVATTPADELAESIVVVDMPIDPIYTDVDTYDRCTIAP